MKPAVHALYWEILHKNRLVFVALAGLLGLGIALTWAASASDPASPTLAAYRGIVLTSFLVSLLLVFAPFMMMESSGGWRMNSMLTRWFSLPMPTLHMVALPLIAGFACVALVIWLWALVLRYIAPGLDPFYTATVLASGLVVMNALAWTVPRKPSQYWAAVAMFFPLLLLLTIVPQDRPGSEEFRHRAVPALVVLSAVLLGYSVFAASKNRCGAWPGEIRLDWLWGMLRGSSIPPRGYRSAVGALFRSEVIPNLRLLGTSWLVLILTVFTWISLSIKERRPDLAFDPRLLPLAAIVILPIFGVIWMAVWGLMGGGEPGAIFRTRLTSYRATLPVTCGMLAAQRLLMLLGGWLVVWGPIALLSFFYSPDLLGVSEEGRPEMQVWIARYMALGACVLAGGLPLFLLGRFEGFPNVLLTSVCAWAVSAGVLMNLRVPAEDPPGWRWGLLLVLFGVKLLATAWALASAMIKRHVTWRFPLALAATWGVLAALLLWGMPLLTAGSTWDALVTLLLLPLARPAWCPLAVAANRHR